MLQEEEEEEGEELEEEEPLRKLQRHLRHGRVNTAPLLTRQQVRTVTCVISHGELVFICLVLSIIK